MATDVQRQKRRQILRAAITVFARSGYHSSRVSDVAKEAGVAWARLSLLRLEGGLARAIFRRTWSRMLEAVEEVEQEDAPARQLAAVAKIVLGAWPVDPDLVRVLVREVARSPQLGREVDEIAHAFAALERIVLGEERGEFRTDVDSRLAAWISTARSRRSSPAGCSSGCPLGRTTSSGRSRPWSPCSPTVSLWIDSSIDFD